MEQPHRLDHCEVLGVLGASPHPVRLDQEDRTEHSGGDRVDQAGAGDRPQQQRGRDHHPAVEHHLATDLAGRLHDRQHRDVDVGVVLAVAQGQGPGVRRGPEEHHREQHDRDPRQLVGDRGPADQGREAAGDAAPDDVLGGPPLEQHRVAEDIERVGEHGQRRRQRVDPDREHDRGQHAQGGREDQGRGGSDDVPRERPAAGPAHLLVDVAVVDAVVRRRRPGRERAADHRGDDQPELGHALRGEEHHRHRGEQQELDDPRLGEADVGRQHVLHPGGGHDVGPRHCTRRLTDVRHGILGFDGVRYLSENGLPERV